MKTFSYSDVKHSPTVPLLFLTVEKIECENFDFVLLLLSSFLFFFIKHNSKSTRCIQTICTILCIYNNLFCTGEPCLVTIGELCIQTRNTTTFRYNILCVLRGHSQFFATSYVIMMFESDPPLPTSVTRNPNIFLVTP